MKASEPQGEAVRPILTNDKDLIETNNREHVNSGGATSSTDNGIPAGIPEDGEEGQKSKGIRCGIKPTTAEIDEHERTHIPFREWCKHCVYGKAQNEAHRSHDGKSMGYHKLSLTTCI